MAQRNVQSGPLTDQEIAVGLEAAGYPLELRIFEELRDRGMDPVFGFRSKVEDGDVPTKDIDILAREHIVIQRANGSPAFAQLKAMIAVKKIHDGAFIGFTSTEPPTSAEIRSLRARVGGLPHWRAIPQEGFDAYGEHFHGADGIGATLEGLHAGPICIQWTVVKRSEKHNGEARADQEKGVYDDVATTIRSSAIQARDVTLHLLSLGRDQSKPNLHFFFPTLVLDAPLRTYDPTTRTLTSVDALAVKVVMDTHLGVTPVLVDVVSSTALQAFVERYRAAGKAMRAWLEANALVLGVAGVQQHDEHTEAVKERQRDAWAQGGKS